MTCFISRWSNLTFNDDVCDDTSVLFIHKESTFHSEGTSYWFNFIEIEKILQCKESSNIIIIPSVFWDFSIETISHISRSVSDSQIKACLHFQQTFSSQKSKIFQNIKSRIRDKVRNVMKSIQKIGVEKWTHAFIVMYEWLSHQVCLSLFNRDPIKQSLSYAEKRIQACLHFQQIHDLNCVFGSGSTL